MSYHINMDGKIYPCRAKVMSCPYGPESHAKYKEDLYHKALAMHRTVEVSQTAKSVLKQTGNLETLAPLSGEIERTDAPIELIQSSYEYAANSVRNGAVGKPVKLTSEEKKLLVDAEHTVASFLYNDGFVYYLDELPAEIVISGRKIHKEKYGGKVVSYPGILTSAPSDSDDKWLATFGPKINAAYKKSNSVSAPYTPEERDKIAGELEAKFRDYSELLNTSKQISQPYVDLPESDEELEEMLASKTTEELITLHDEFSASEDEIAASVYKFHNFAYIYDSDLSPAANQKLEQWYNRNKVAYQRYQIGTSRRILFSLKIADELERRSVVYGDKMRNDKKIGAEFDYPTKTNRQ